MVKCHKIIWFIVGVSFICFATSCLESRIDEDLEPHFNSDEYLPTPSSTPRVAQELSLPLVLEEERSGDSFEKFAAPLFRSHIAFWSNRSGRGEVYSVRPDGTDLRCISCGYGLSVNEPRWAPNGRSMALLSLGDVRQGSTDGDHFNISSARFDGSGLIDLICEGSEVACTDGSNDHSYAWSPDSDSIAFVSDRDGMEQIYVMDADGGNQRRVIDSELHARSPDWSPDGTRIVYETESTTDFQIRVVNLDTKSAVNLTTGDSFNCCARWSPDGESIAFVSDRDGNYEIYVMDEDGINATRLSHNSGRDYDPLWSPTGDYIAFVSLDNGRPIIKVVTPDGVYQKSLVSTIGSSSFRVFDWSPDGNQIAYVTRQGSNFEIFAVTIDSLDILNITDSLSIDLHPSWIGY